MTKEITEAIGKRQVLRNHTPVVANITTVFDWEIDLFSVNKEGYIYEFEVKISRADFVKDKKKKKWTCPYRTLPQNTPNYYSYACIEGLILVNEIPDFAGLYYYKEREIIEIKSPKLRHKFKKDFTEINMKVARMYSQREFLGRTLVSHINKGIRERNEERARENREAQEKFMQQWRESDLKL
jgi:hypothetical protein